VANPSQKIQFFANVNSKYKRRRKNSSSEEKTSLFRLETKEIKWELDENLYVKENAIKYIPDRSLEKD